MCIRDRPIRLLSGTGDELTGEITDLLPTPGFTVLQLPFGGERSAERRQVLSRLNELRSRLADPDQGSLVILGTSTLAAECVSAAADLWSVRSLFLSIIAPTLAVVPSEIETRPDDLGDALLFPAYTIAERERTERTPHTLRLLAVALSLIHIYHPRPSRPSRPPRTARVPRRTTASLRPVSYTHLDVYKRQPQRL